MSEYSLKAKALLFEYVWSEKELLEISENKSPGLTWLSPLVLGRGSVALLVLGCGSIVIQTGSWLRLSIWFPGSNVERIRTSLFIAQKGSIWSHKVRTTSLLLLLNKKIILKLFEDFFPTEWKETFHSAVVDSLEQRIVIVEVECHRGRQIYTELSQQSNYVSTILPFLRRKNYSERI